MSLALRVFLCYLALLAAAEDNIQIVEVAQGQNISLPCTAGSKPRVDYRSCRWYKESVDPRLTGLVSRSPPNGMLKWYVGADLRISLEYPSLNLLLPEVSCSDSGVYQCHMAAPVGEQNREGRIRLFVTDCPIDFEIPKIPETEVIPEQDLNQPELPLLLLAAGLGLLAAMGISLIYLCVRRAKWNKAKSVDKLLYPDLSYPLEKQGLILPNFTPFQNPKTSPLNFNSV